MAGNTFGNIFKLTTFGESHGLAIGGIIDGCPSGISIDVEAIQNQLDRRRPGQSEVSTERNEEDKVEFLSGILDGKTLGTPIGFTIKNKDARSGDYSELSKLYRPSHADYTYEKKYGIRDARGGGRSSARETACRIVGGAIAAQVLATKNIKTTAFVSQIGDVILEEEYSELNLKKIDDNIVRCPDQKVAKEMIDLIKATKDEGDSLGGQISCVITGTPVGLGEPVFDRINADLAKAMFSINTVKGFELGSGFSATLMKGSEHNDQFIVDGDEISTLTNNSGGIQGGITNGEDIYFNVGFKPVATIMQKQKTVSSEGTSVEMKAKGRHDPCVLPRAVPIVEAMASMVILDHILRNQTTRLA